MRKIVLIVSSLIAFHLSTFAQPLNEEQIQLNVRSEIDSLIKVLPTMKGVNKIDCLNRQAYNYFSLWINWKLEADSAYPYAIQAYNEAKKIGYKKGLAYACLRLGAIESLQYGFDFQVNKKRDSTRLNKQEKYANEALLLGNEIKDNAIIGGAYRMHGFVAEDRGDFPKQVTNLEKAAYYLENSGNQPYEGVYRDLNDFDCKECNGKETALGRVYKELSGAYGAVRDFDSNQAVLKKALLNFRKSENIGAESHTLWWISADLIIRGYFDSALQYCERNIKVAEEAIKNKQTEGWSFGQSFSLMSELYKNAGDYETALSYIRRGYDYFPRDTFSMDLWAAQMGDVHRLMGNTDSAMYYLTPFATRPQEWVLTSMTNSGTTNLIILYNSLKEYDKALTLLKAFKNNRQPPAKGIVLTLTANAYFGKKDYTTALQYAQEGLSLLKPLKSRTRIVENYKLLSEIFHELGKNDSAYFYLSAYTILRDSLLNNQFYFRLNSYKKQAEEERKTSQLNLLNKDNQLKEQKLKQQAFVKNSLTAGIILLFLLGIFIFRNLSLKRKNDKLRLQKNLEMQQLASEKKHAELQQQALELEMQALRARMNPHFIFNCLSSINRFIFKNDNKMASDYLTRFSRLIRMVLMHSQKKLIALEDELEMLKLYLDLERLRFKDAFDYSITSTNIVDDGAIFIPPLLLQPFCENAVWHGLMHKDTKGHLNIIISEVISENEKVLHCIIEDDGVGREKAAELKSKSAENEKSLGLKITTERLALLNQEINFSSFYRIEDIRNENNEVTGTRVQLKVRYKESVEELA